MHLQTKMKQTIDCYYNNGNWALHKGAYECRIVNQIIIDSNNAEYEFRGVQKYEMTNNDVMGINFIRCTMTRVPKGLIKIFPNAKFLQLWDCKLKSVEREDLKEFSKFTDLTIVFNEIPFIPGDLLADMKDLIGVWLHDNKTQIIEPNILDGLDNLIIADFSNNLCIDKKFDNLEERGNATLNELKNEIRITYHNSPWKSIFEKIKQLEVEIERMAEKSTSKVADDILKIMQYDNFKDFTIFVNGEKFKAHKLVLASRSPVFAETIQSDIHAEYLNLNDISCEIFREILNFIYTDEFPKSDDIDFVKIFIAASRLKLTKLKDFASDKLIEIINDKNALDFLDLANKFENQKLKQKSFEKIKKLLEGIQIDDNLAGNVVKLKKILEIKKQKEEIIKAMDDEILQMLKI
ncbi:hypothetical protein PVAND_000926 [Polypedilum vanderplanki]|uniref:BTB domain-containing protein n=1 Tax=Polypedilum vanderplanki TaxID=319348 RepID=A0A9J6BMP5_POLVA|nr:hypothetical protein PVAND_000926 [Polypedilum vanderplanki]